MSQVPSSLSIVRWYKQYGRDLPWRHTQDAYAIWLSEVILQQTRIEQGTAYWHRFLRTYPTVESLAAASEDDVLLLWQGLGYYSRARNLLAAARQIVAQGGFPTHSEELRQLKGIGPYTAAAIASFAFNEQIATVDGNVLRVLARHYGIDTPINTTAGKKTFESLAQELLPPKEAAAFNQGMMDLGATICTPTSPHCEQCPIAESCVALHEDSVKTLPVKEHRMLIHTRHLTYIYIRFNGQTLLHRRSSGDIWQGLWEPLLLSDSNHPERNVTLPPEIKPQLVVKDFKHQLTHQTIFADLCMAELSNPSNQSLPSLFSLSSLPSNLIMIPEQDLDNYAQPQLIKKLLEKLHNEGL